MESHYVCAFARRLIGELRHCPTSSRKGFFADAGDPDARLMFECLLDYARREGRAGLNSPAEPRRTRPRQQRKGRLIPA